MDADLKLITQSLESFSKRLRKVEILSKPQIFSVDSFIELTDSPDTYIPYGGAAVVVNAAGDGLDFSPFGLSCVQFICGGVGWRAIGGALPRVLVHEEAFQLDDQGDARGENAVDLQQDRYVSYEVAAGPRSMILGGLENMTAVDRVGTVIMGGWNSDREDSDYDFIIGDSNDCRGTAYGCFNSSFLTVYATGIDGVQDALFGYGHETNDTIGTVAFIESNEIKKNAVDHPAYCGAHGWNNTIDGDCVNDYSWGESNYIEGKNPGSLMTAHIGFIFGYNNAIRYGQECTIIMGVTASSFMPDTGTDTFFQGSWIFSGESPNEFPAGWPPHTGYNQDRWVCQNEAITTWPASWTTSNFEFPLLSDSIWFFEIMIAGTEEGCANSYAWKITGTIENDGGTTTLLTSTVTNIYRDVVTKEWRAIADDTNDRLVFQFRDTAGPDATECNIQMSMMAIEVGFD